VDLGFSRLSPFGLVGRIVESGGKIGLGRDDDVDALAKRVCIGALLVDRGGDEGGVCFRVSFGYWIKLPVAPRFIGIVVALCFISRGVIVRGSAECVPGTDPGRWLVVGISVCSEGSYGGRRIPGTGPSEYEGGAAARSAGWPAIGDGVVPGGGSPARRFFFL